jgi:hypothetical protein
MNDYEMAKNGEAGLPARASEAPLPATYGDGDPFLAHGMGGGNNRTIGKFLKVPAGQNGEYTYRAENDEIVIPRGTEMQVAVDKLGLRAVRWGGSKVAEQIVGYLADGFKLPKREALGYTDEEVWERDDAGRPRDPWKLENLLPMKRLSNGELFTAFISAKGSPDDAVRHLTMMYGRSDRTKYPVVRLGRDSFVSKRNGHRSWFPTLPLTGIWLPKAEFVALETGEPTAKVDRAGHRGYAPQRDYQAPVDADWGQDDPGPMEIPDYVR